MEKLRLSNNEKVAIVNELCKRLGADATEYEISKTFFDNIKDMPTKREIGFDKWPQIRKWMVIDFRQAKEYELSRQQGMAGSNQELEAKLKKLEAEIQNLKSHQGKNDEKAIEVIAAANKAISDRQERLDKQCDQIFNNHAGVIAKIETQVINHNAILEVVVKNQQSEAEAIAELAKGAHDLARATREIFVTLDHHKDLLTPTIAKEILRIEEEVLPIINAVLAIPTTTYKIAVVGLIPTQQSIIKEEYGSRLKITFISADELKGSKCADRMKGADAIFVMTGFVSHAAVMKQFKDKTRNCNGGMTGLKKEINLFLKMVVEKAQ